MYYCDDCGREKGWPTDALLRSRGPCGICGKRAVCNNIATKDLPEERAENDPKGTFYLAPGEKKTVVLLDPEAAKVTTSYFCPKCGTKRTVPVEQDNVECQNCGRSLAGLDGEDDN